MWNEDGGPRISFEYVSDRRAALANHFQIDLCVSVRTTQLVEHALAFG